MFDIKKTEHCTITDIAKMANVSPASVSRVLSGSPGVNKAKRKEILSIIEKTGYHPSATARALVSGKSKVVGLIVRDLENQYYSLLAVHIQKFLLKFGYMTMVFNIDADASTLEERNRLLEVIKMYEFAGLLVSIRCDDILSEVIEDCACPLVLLNRAFDIGADQVTQNDFQTGYLAASHLLQLGHKDFIHVAGPLTDNATCRFRTEGFVQALAAQGITMASENIIPSNYSVLSAYEHMCEYFDARELHQLPTAAFINTNSMALGFLKACGERGFRIPEDISIVTVDNLPILDIPGINLTAVGVSMEQLAKSTVDVLMKRIESKAGKQRFVVLQPELVVRGSTAPPNR